MILISYPFILLEKHLYKDYFIFKWIIIQIFYEEDNTYMADYISKHSGQNIDNGVQKALDWDPNIIGCKRVTSSMSAPLDMNTFLDSGYWVVDYFINGPQNLLDFSPLPFIVSDTVINGAVVSKTQSVSINLVQAYRVYTVDTATWSDWTYSGFPKIVKATGTGSELIVTDSSINLVDMADFTIQVPATVENNAVLTVNELGPYPIKTPDGENMIRDLFVAGSFMTLIYNAQQKVFYTFSAKINSEGRYAPLEEAVPTIEVPADTVSEPDKTIFAVTFPDNCVQAFLVPDTNYPLSENAIFKVGEEVVTAKLPNGASLPNYYFVANAKVLCSYDDSTKTLWFCGGGATGDIERAVFQDWNDTENTPGSPVLNNADLFGNQPPSYYATKKEVENKQEVVYAQKLKQNDLEYTPDSFVLSENYVLQNTYSATEHWTGKYWINGKKIYERTFTGDLGTGMTGAGTVELVTLDAGSALVGAETIIYSRTGDAYIPGDLGVQGDTYSKENQNVCYVGIAPDQKVTFYYHPTATASEYGYSYAVTLRYTKND